MEKKSEIVDVQTLPLVAGFSWSVGFLMERFIRSLAKRELLAARCPACAYTYVPPRSRCGKCHARIQEEDLIPISGKGTVIGHTTAFVSLDGQGNLSDVKVPGIIGAIKFDKADSTVFLAIEGVSPDDVKEGINVEIQWRKQTKGELADIQCVKPVR